MGCRRVPCSGSVRNCARASSRRFRFFCDISIPLKPCLAKTIMLRVANQKWFGPGLRFVAWFPPTGLHVSMHPWTHGLEGGRRQAAARGKSHSHTRAPEVRRSKPTRPGAAIPSVWPESTALNLRWRGHGDEPVPDCRRAQDVEFTFCKLSAYRNVCRQESRLMSLRVRRQPFFD